MMKSIQFFGLSIILLFTVSCSKENSVENPSNQVNQAEFFKQNVAFTDARVRSLNATEYVREIVLTDFSKNGKMPVSVIFDGTTYFDDESHYDLNSNDGIYTSASKFIHTERVPFYENNKVRSVMEKSITDTKFQFEDQFETFMEVSYNRPSVNNLQSVAYRAKADPGGSISLKCDIEFGTCGCRADRWGWCDCCCFSVSNCEFEVSIEF